MKETCCVMVERNGVREASAKPRRCIPSCACATFAVPSQASTIRFTSGPTYCLELFHEDTGLLGGLGSCPHNRSGSRPRTAPSNSPARPAARAWGPSISPHSVPYGAADPRRHVLHGVSPAEMRSSISTCLAAASAWGSFFRELSIKK